MCFRPGFDSMKEFISVRNRVQADSVFFADSCTVGNGRYLRRVKSNGA